MQHLYDRAINATDDAGWLFIRLADTSEMEAGLYQKFFDQNAERIETRKKRLLEEVAELVERHRQHTSSGTDHILDLETSEALIALRTLQVSLVNATWMEDEQAGRIRAVAALNDALLKHIIRPSAKTFKKALAINAIETAVNFGASFAGPLGQIPDLAMRGYKLSRLEKEAGEAAERHILYVRDYCEAVDRWCVAAQHLINRLQASAASLP